MKDTGVEPENPTDDEQNNEEGGNTEETPGDNDTPVIETPVTETPEESPEDPAEQPVFPGRADRETRCFHHTPRTWVCKCRTKRIWGQRGHNGAVQHSFYFRGGRMGR